MVKELTFGYSPCPNDTFMFNAIAHGDVRVDDHTIRPFLQDIDTLNGLAMDAVLDITKLSLYAWMAVKDHYHMLDSGAAMGFGCGPVLISKTRLSRSEMGHCRVALPGQWTTAHLLLRLWAPHARQRIFMPYDRIFEALTTGQADCGVIIHESRFTFEAGGFRLVTDLGAWWEEETGLPIPLGCIAAHKRLDDTLLQQIDAAIHTSIQKAMVEPDEALPYIRRYAREMDDGVLKAHIRTFVNAFSLDLTGQGHRAIGALEAMARQAGVI